MKKVIRSIICCLLCIALSGVLAFAEGEPATMNMSWRADYTNNQLVINFKSPADYNQVVTVVMYPASVVGNPTIGDYVRIWEDTVAPGKVGEVKFAITESLGEADGRYKVRIQGSGYMASSCKEEQVVTIKKPSVAGNLLSRINAATTWTEAGSLLTEGKDTLQISITDNPALLEKLMTAFLSVRDADYEGAFANLDEVRDAYKKSDVVVYLHETDSTKAGLIEKVEANADVIGFDVTDVDYELYKDYIYTQILANKDNYNGVKIENTELVKNALIEYRVIAVVNNSDQDKLLEKVPVYYDDFGSNSSYLIYKNFSLANKEKVIRQIYNKGFTSALAIKTAFDGAVEAVSLSLGGGDIGGGIGGGETAPLDPGTLGGETVITPLPAGTFTDCNKDHWAYEYIKELSEAGIIDGYEDGTFLPEKNVNREEFVKLIVSGTGLYNSNAEIDFADVPKTAWFYKYVASAKEAGIVSGVSDFSFGAGGLMTRQDVAVIVSRIVDKFNISVPEAGGMKIFNDEDEMSDYAKDAIDKLVRLGVLDGFADGSFKPKDALTRAQAAKIISLVRELI